MRLIQLTRAARENSGEKRMFAEVEAPADCSKADVGILDLRQDAHSAARPRSRGSAP